MPKRSWRTFDGGPPAAAAVLRWTPPGGSKQVVPPEVLLHDAGTPVKDVMREPPATVLTGDGLKDVAGAASKYNLMTVPVVDPAGALQGMVTVDDILSEVIDAR